jgi:hypothetical protein
MTKRKHNEALETPLIKWPGGKSKEFQHFAELIPPFERYIEPFFGGGGVFFRLQPESAMINDVCLELVQFYRYVKGEPGAAEFGKLLRAYADTWAKAGEVATKMMPSLKEAYASKASADCPEPEIVSSVGVVFQKHKSSCALLSASPVCLDKDQFWKEVQEALVEKMIRTAKLEKIKGKLPAGDLEKNLETGIRGGIYMYYRGMMNSLRGSKASLMPLRIANYYFIREFCYGSIRTSLEKLSVFCRRKSGTFFRESKLETKTLRISFVRPSWDPAISCSSIRLTTLISAPMRTLSSGREINPAWPACSSERRPSSCW